MSTKKNKEVIPPRIVVVYEIISEVFEDRSKIFKSPSGRNEVFLFRVKLKPIKIFKKPIDFRSLIEDLTFIKDKRKWTG